MTEYGTVIMGHSNSDEPPIEITQEMLDASIARVTWFEVSSD